CIRLRQCLRRQHRPGITGLECLLGPRPNRREQLLPHRRPPTPPRVPESTATNSTARTENLRGQASPRRPVQVEPLRNLLVERFSLPKHEIKRLYLVIRPRSAAAVTSLYAPVPSPAGVLPSATTSAHPMYSVTRLLGLAPSSTGQRQI